MTPLEKLKSNLGGLIKYAISYGGFNPDGTRGRYSPGNHSKSYTSVSHSNSDDAVADEENENTNSWIEEKDFQTFDQEQKEHFALDHDGRINLKHPESFLERYDRLPTAAYKPALWPNVMGGNATFSPAHSRNANHPNPYLRSKTPGMHGSHPSAASNQPGSVFDAMRQNSIDSGRYGILRPAQQKDIPNVRAPGKWSEFVADPNGVSSATQSRLNAKFMFRKPGTGSGPNLVRNTTGHRVKNDPYTGKDMHQFVDPVQAWHVQRQSYKDTAKRIQNRQATPPPPVHPPLPGPNATP